MVSDQVILLLTALAQLQHIWVQSAEKRKLTAALLLDLSAAFDVVDHKILLEKLTLYGLSENTVNWFRSYLADRYQYVMVESKLSNPLSVGEQGVPQGSLLGPLCFLIYYNDFPAARKDGESVVYADDDTDNVCSESPQILQNKIQAEADSSVKWVNDNRLVCSGSKTKLLVIGSRELRKSKLEQSGLTLSVCVAGHVVKESASEKLLGININNSLTWTNHLHGNEEHKGLLNKLSQRAGLIRKLSSLMPSNRLRIISNGIFFSLLNYSLPIFGSVSGLLRYAEGQERYLSMSREDSRQVQVIINVVLRALTKLPFETPVQTLLEQSGLLSFHQMCAHSTMKLAHRILKTEQPEVLFSILSNHRPIGNRSRRQSVVQTKFRLSVSRESFISQAAKLFYSLPEEIQMTRNPMIFKRETRKWVERNVTIYM